MYKFLLNRTSDPSESVLVNERGERGIRYVKRTLLIITILVLVFLARAISADIVPRVIALCVVLNICLISYLLLKQELLSLSIFVLMVGIAVAVVTSVLTSGGINNVSVGWVLLVPCVAGLLGGRTFCAVWATLALFFMLFLIVSENYGIVWPDLTPDNSRGVQARLHVVMQLFFLTTVILIFISESEKYEHSIHSQLVKEQYEVSQRRKVEAQLRASSEAKTRFLAHMSHEFKTPLNSIIGYSKFMLGRKYLLEKNQVEAFECINRNGYVLLEMVNHLLELARLDREENNTLEQRIDLKDLINEIISFKAFEEKLGDRTLVVGKIERCYIKGSLGDITKMITVLVEFAIAQTVEGKIEVGLDVIERATKKYCQLVVTDDSKDVDPNRLKSLLSIEAEKGDKVGAYISGGGLGLALVGSIVKNLYGDIEMMRNKRGGITYVIAIPHDA